MIVLRLFTTTDCERYIGSNNADSVRCLFCECNDKGILLDIIADLLLFCLLIYLRGDIHAVCRAFIYNLRFVPFRKCAPPRNHRQQAVAPLRRLEMNPPRIALPTWLHVHWHQNNLLESNVAVRLLNA
jgi:hypothetical protein